MDIRLSILSALLLVSISINNVYSKNIYLKAELPIYKKYDGINKKDAKDHKLSSISDSYGFGLGYNFSNYVETELIFNQMKYFIYTSTYDVGNVHHKHTHIIPPPTYKLPDKLVPYFSDKRGHEKGLCPCGVMSPTEAEADTSKVFGKSEFLKSTGKSEEIELNSSHPALKNVNSSIIQMKLQALIASVKFKAHNEGRVIPFLSLGAGVSHMKINHTASKLDESGMNDVPTLKNKTSFAYRVGVGTKIKISSKVALELSARYFNYGKYKLSNDVSKKITGHDFSAGIILGF